MILPETPFFDSDKVFERDRSLIDAFCEKSGVELLTVGVNNEDVPPNGLMYFFSDNSGGYSREGLNASLGIPTIGIR